MRPLITILSIIVISINVLAQDAYLTLNIEEDQPIISKHIYGHFSEHLGRCVYDGYWVDEGMNVPKKDRIRLDVVEALKKINIPNLRWPGGCFADEYHWRDGIGPREERPSMVNTHWGMIVEDNSFGTHEFLELCDLLDTDPYIAANVGSGTVKEMNDWIEYVNYNGESTLARLRSENGHPEPYNVEFWGIGNESWGCGGNMTVEYFADVYKRYATYAKSYPGTRIKRIASGANTTDYHWTEVMMREARRQMWGLSVHYYTVPTGNWSAKGSATSFTEREYFETMDRALFMNELLDKHIAIMDHYDPDNRVALVVDEWGIWTDSEPGSNSSFLYQQNSLRDALIAGSILNIFNNRADRIRMANLAQTVNVLQALILTDKEKMILTPTYHVFDLYQVHQDAKLIPFLIKTPDYVSGEDKLPAVNVSASMDDTGKVHITLVNIDPNNAITISGVLNGFIWKNVTGRIVTSKNVTDHNKFDNPEVVKTATFNGAKKTKDGLSVELPAKSVVMLELN